MSLFNELKRRNVFRVGIAYIVVAWAFEMTPEGIKREHEVDRSQSITLQTGKKLNLMITAVMALALAYFAYDKADTSYGKIPNEQAQAQSKLYLDKALSLDENPEYEAMQARMIEHLNRERQKLGLEPV